MDPVLLKGLYYARQIGRRSGLDLLGGLEELRRLYLEYQETADLCLDLVDLWSNEDQGPDEEPGEDRNGLGSKGC